MINKVSIIKYRKLQNLDIDFTPEVNFVSGANGTCKSSLLHMVSNAFQKVVATKANLKDKNCISVINAINSGLNQKIETLTRDSKQYNDPAKEIKGTLFSISYFDGTNLDFRRHNSKIAERFAIKPKYSHQKPKENLPFIPVIYLGLSRLYPIGEFQDNNAIEKIKYKLPDNYRKDLVELYEQLMHIQISALQPQRMKGVKVRNDFSTSQNGVDGNTISSGEDNVFIILTALLSLKYYYDSLQETTDNNESVLLIDEFDATLHPSLQEALLDVIRDFSKKYKIQVISTTHSLSLLKYAFTKKDNVIYLCDNIENVYAMKNPDIHKIEMKLKNISREAFYADKEIPVFMEDAEARMFMGYYMSYLQEHDCNFSRIKSSFHFVEAPFGADSLRGMFKDERLTKIMQAICILDGDKTEEHPEYVIVLPGGKSPERVIFDYAEKLYNDSQNDFWRTSEATQNNFDRPYYRDHIQSAYQQALQPTPDREKLKNVWNDNKTFVALVIKTWLNDSVNQGDIQKFTAKFHTLFFKTAEHHGLNRRDWPSKKDGVKGHE